MELSRRALLRGAVGTTVAVAAPVRLLAGTAWAAAPLSRARFSAQLQTLFRFTVGTSAVDLRLVDVADGPKPSKKGECFALQFDGGRQAIAQGTYAVAHKTLGVFALFVVPTDRGPLAIYNVL